jgi:ABC-2 type transport system ATP-binding protein
MEKENAIITVKELIKNYDDFKAVQGLSFDVYKHEIFGLLGPNGAGKTTTLRNHRNLTHQNFWGGNYVDGFSVDDKKMLIP